MTAIIILAVMWLIILAGIVWIIATTARIDKEKRSPFDDENRDFKL